MQKYGVSVGIYPSTALKAFREIKAPQSKYDLRLRCLVSGGEPVSGELVSWVRETLGTQFNQAYGQTEANYFIGHCTALEDSPIEPLGKGYPGHHVAIVDSEGQVLKPGEEGDIALHRHNPVIMKEYWRKPDATKEKFAGDWLLTGDKAYQDERGYIYFLGRKDDIIKSSGYRIGPTEVEAAIMQYPGVASCAVVGVPDDQRGQVVKAFIRMMPGVLQNEETTRGIQQHVKSQLGAHEYPRQIEYVSEFPLTVTGKIKRKELRDLEEALYIAKRKGAETQEREQQCHS